MTIRDQIIEANKAYRLGRPIMADQSFDDLCEAYEKTVTPEEYAAFRDSLHEETGKVRHPFIMGSLDKMKAEEPAKLLSWIASWVLPTNPVLSVSAKIDGISCRLHYEKGRMVGATTRGDGHAGTDITDKVKLVGNGVPGTVPNRRGPLDIRGELVIKDADFAAIAGQFANPRNACAGIMGQKTAEPDLLKHISFVAYEIMGGELAKREQFSRLASLGFDVVWNAEIPLDPVPDGFVTRLTTLAEQDFGYPTDGLVLSSPLYKAENRYRPQAQVAFKLNQLVSRSKIIGIEWGNPSKDGRMSPVAVIDPIGIGGSTISRVTVNNMDWIRQMGIGIGSTVEIVKSGDIIPKITRVLASGTTTPIRPPKACPVCGASVVRDGCDIRCPNEGCPSRGYERVLTFLANIGIKRVSRKSLEAWGIDSFDKLLGFRGNPKYKMEVYFEKEISRCVMGASPVDLFKALPFKDLAEITLKKIIGHYGYRNLQDGRVDPDSFPEGVGRKTMEAFLACAAANFAIVGKIVRDPRYHGALFADVERNDRQGGSKGSVCFTGALNTMTRAEASKRAEAAGYEVRTSVAKGVTYLVTNDPGSGSSKNKKAQHLGTKIITEEEFLELLQVARRPGRKARAD